MKNKLIYLQPLLLAICVLITTDWTGDWTKPVYESILYVYVKLMAWLSTVVLWSAGIVIVALLFINKRYLKAVIILCLNIYISSFSNIYYIFDGRKDNRYIPSSIQDAKDKGAFICEYKQVNEVVLLDSVELKVKEAFACQYCFYDDKDVIHTAPDMLPYFVACPMNQEQMKAFRKTFYIEQFGQRSSLHFIDDIWCPSIDIDTITGLPPEEIVLRIRQDIKDTSGHCKEIYVDSICFVRMQEED